VSARHLVHASGVESHRFVGWGATVAATIVSTIVLDLAATAAGALLLASQVFNGLSPAAAYILLAATYVMWIVALRVNLTANWRLLEGTGTSSNLLSKMTFELARRRSCGERGRRIASAVGYVATELAKEAPYYMGVAGAAALSDAVSATDAVVFLAGTNFGAAACELGLARLSRTVLDRLPTRLPSPAPGNPASG
jgi:hypothetical protein